MTQAITGFAVASGSMMHGKRSPRQRKNHCTADERRNTRSKELVATASRSVIEDVKKQQV